MNRRQYCPILFVAALFSFLPGSVSFGQFSGSRGGVGQATAGHGAGSSTELATLSREVAEGFITIEGSAEVRVRPTEIRIVLAVTAEGESPSECRRIVQAKIDALRAAWTRDGVNKTNIVDDFIAVLPRYDFQLEEQQGRKVAVERKAGYLMQTNLHVAVKDDAQAMRAINVAFENDVADIIAFDYWSKELDDLKADARKSAVKAARAKSDVLLGALFDKTPAIINVQEATTVHYPEALYESFENTHGQQYSSGYLSRDYPVIRTFRPKNTYYRGLYADTDIQARELPMRSEISIVSKVRLYFASPAAGKQAKPSGK